MCIAGTPDLIFWVTNEQGELTIEDGVPVVRIIDWKSCSNTKAWTTQVSNGQLDNRLGMSCVQLNLYAYILEQEYGVKVRECLIVFCGSSPSVYTAKRIQDATIRTWLTEAAIAYDPSRARTEMESSCDGRLSSGLTVGIEGVLALPGTRGKGRPRKRQELDLSRAIQLSMDIWKEEQKKRRLLVSS